MRERNKRNIVIGILCVMVVFMSVGYAILSQNLNINGTANITGSWDIYIDSITFNSNESSSTTSGTGEVDTSDKTKASYSANLLKPQDVVVYDVVVANNGTIDAILDDITLTPVDNEYFKFETIGIEKGEELNAKTGDNPTTKEFKIKITFKDSVTEANMPALGTKVDGFVKLDYVQEGVKFETEDVPGGDEIPTESSPFKVTDNGVLLHYERQSDETSVVVPAEVNGVKIKSIVGYAFLKGDAILVNEGSAIILINMDYMELAKQMSQMNGMTLTTIDEFGHGSDPFEVTNLSGKVTIDMSLPEIAVDSYERESNHYLASIDLSGMIYLEEIGDFAFIGYTKTNENGNCPTGTQASGCGAAPLTSIKLPMNGVLHTIGEEAFADNQLTTIEFPNTLISIGKDAFKYNQITDLEIPSSVTTIGKNAFWNNRISTLIFKDTSDNQSQLTSIGESAFSSNFIAGEIIIPSSVTTIGAYAFNGGAHIFTKIIIKRPDSTGMTLGFIWYNEAEVIYDPNYVG